MVNFYDAERNGFLCYQDFLQVVLPCEDMNLRIETTNRPFMRISRHETLPFDMETALVNVLVQELHVFKELEKMTYDLERRPDYSPLAVFRCVDRENAGKIGVGNLNHFFRNNGIMLTDREILALIRRLDTTADQTIAYEELKDYLDDQVSFRSQQTMVSMAKGTPAVRKVMHKDLLKAQDASVGVYQKMWGHQSNPKYSQSPERFQNHVLEQRVFENNPLATKKKKKRAKSAYSQRVPGRRAGGPVDSSQKLSKFSNPGDRPQHKRAHKVNQSMINTSLPSGNPAFAQAMNPGGKQSDFMKNMNKPLLRN